MAHPLTKESSFGYQLLKKFLTLSSKEKKWNNKFLEAYEGDYWQAGKGYLGPPPKASDKDSQALWQTFASRFISRNVISEVVARVSNSFLGKDPDWKYVVDGKQVKRRTGTSNPAKSNATGSTSPKTGNAESESILDEMDMVLGEYWTNEGLSSKLIECFEKRLVAGRCSLRIYIPGKYRDDDGFIRAKSIAEAFKYIKVEVIGPESSRSITTDGETIALVTYKVVTDWVNMQTKDVIEFSFVDDNNMTFVGTFKDGGEDGLDNADISSEINVDEKNLIYEMSGKPFVTEQLWKCNGLLNLALTMAGFGLVESGFRELILTNVELEMEEIPGEDGATKRVPKGIKRGGGAVQNMVGMETVNYETGERTLHTPGVHTIDPSPLDTYKDGKDLAYESCLEEAHEKYALISGDATTTGESRIQAMGDFYLKIKPYKPEIDQTGSWLLTVLIRIAALMAGKETEFENTSVLMDTTIRIANLTADERRIVLEMRQQGVISFETARVLLGVEDPILEEELVQKDRAQQIEFAKEQFKANPTAGQSGNGFGAGNGKQPTNTSKDVNGNNVTKTQ